MLEHDDPARRGADAKKALQQVQAAAASPATAAAAWEEAVRITQFEGVAREGTQFKEWREGEGDTLKEKEAAGAAQLHFIVKTWPSHPRAMAVGQSRASGIQLDLHMARANPAA